MRRLLILAALLATTPAYAQSPEAMRARAIRRAEIARRNWSQQEAMRLLFGPNGIPALTRPADPWNARGYYYRRPVRRYPIRYYR